MQSLGQMMRVLTQAILLFILLGISRAEVAAPSNEVAPRKIVYEMDIDNLIDDNMETIRELAWQLDPFKLDDIKFLVTDKIYMILYNGWAQNLPELIRAGKCKIKYTDKKLNVDLNLGWKDLVFDYRYLMKVIFKREGDMHGSMSKVNAHIALEINFSNYHITLKNLELQNEGKLNIKLERHFFDFIYNMAIKAITRIFPGYTLKTITDKTKMMIMHRIDELNFKLGSIVNGRQFKFIDLTDKSTDDNSQILYNSIDDNNIN